MMLPATIGVVLALFAPTFPETAATAAFPASEFPRLARGMTLDRSGDYTLWAWGPRDRVWVVSAHDNALTLIGRPRVPSPDRAAPGWQVVGRVPISGAKPMTIRVPEASFESGSIQGNYSSGKLARKTPRSAEVPALLVLSTDPGVEVSGMLDLLRGNLESAAPVEDSRRDSVRTNHEGAGFQPPATAVAWQARAEVMRSRLRVTLGLWPMPSKTPLNPQVYGKVDRDGYSIEKVTLETLPGYFLAGNLYRPAGPPAKAPAMLCPHGHWEEGRVREDVQERCIRFAKLGFVVFLYEMAGYNDSKPFGHAFLDPRLDLWGYSLPSLQTWNSLRALDWVASLPEVDAARIGVTGESGGGTQTFLLAALDPRVAASAPVVMVSERFQGGCVCENASGLRVGTDNVEIAALTAPRPMILVGASGDWTSNTITKVHPAIRGVYEALGVPGEVEARQFDFPHNYNQTSREAVYAFMARKFLGVEDAAATKEGPQTPEKDNDLLAFDAKHPAPSSLKTAAQLEDELIAVRVRQLEKLAPGEDTTAWEAARPGLLEALKVRVGLTNPPRDTLKATEVRRVEIESEGTLVVHSILKRTDRGDAIPVARLSPSHPNGRVAVIFDGRGKAGLRSPLVRSLLDRGVSVIGFDPLFVGESFDPAHPAAKRPETAHSSTYNPSLAADRMQDLATVVAWAGSLEGVREVSLIGQGAAAPLALLARPALAGISKTAVDLQGFDYGDGSKPIDEGVFLPGVLQFGGLKAAAALTSPSPLWIIEGAKDFDPSWPRKAYALDDAGANLKIEAARPSSSDLARWIAP